MKTTEMEKEWLRRVAGGIRPQKQDKESSAPKEVRKSPESPSPEKGKGFNDVAGMDNLKKFVTESFVNVLKNRDCADMYGIKPPSMLFYGPAGCGKTFFTEKMAEEVGIHFMKIVPDDLACTWVHGTQQKIGEVFRTAECKGPTLLFFDEFDAMVSRRTGNADNQHYDGEVNEFLCMLNNAWERGIYVVAATNHPERIDRAVLRTGRIDEMVYIDMPDMEARRSLFQLALSKLPAEDDMDLTRLATLTEGYYCSDIRYIVKSAARKMFNLTIEKNDGVVRKVTQNLLEETIKGKSPSVSGRELREYERVRSEFSPKDEHSKPTTVGFR